MRLGHLRYGNAFTHGRFVCSVQCQLCALHKGLAAADTLARNIAIAAGMERAFRLGNVNGWDEAAISEGYHAADSWEPGCGRSAP